MTTFGLHLFCLILLLILAAGLQVGMVTGQRVFSRHRVLMYSPKKRLRHAYVFYTTMMINLVLLVQIVWVVKRLFY